MADFSEIIRWFKDLASLIDTKPVFRWGIITNADPLLVQLDGDDRPLAGSPSTVIGRLTAGERVLCLMQNRRVTVAGRAGGDPGLRVSSVSMRSGVTAGAYNEIVRDGDMVTLSLSIQSTGFQAGTIKEAAIIPAGFRPKHTNIHYLAYVTGNQSQPAALVRASSNGNIAVTFFAGATQVYAQSMTWRAA